MSDTDSPVEGSGNDTALTVEQGAAAIENLLSRVPDTEESDKDSAANEEGNNDGQSGENVEASTEAATDTGDDDLELDDETVTAEADAPKEPEIKPGQFAPKDAKVKLDDGTTISVADLIAGNMFQRTFTEKTTALAGERKALESERGEFQATKQQIEQQRQIVLTLAQEILPQEPQPPTDPNDPLQELDYQRDLRAYQQKMGKLHTIWQAEQQAQAEAAKTWQEEQKKAAEEAAAAHQAMLAAESEKLLSKLPKLKDEKEFQAFRSEILDNATAYYGFKPDEIVNASGDHRTLLVLADAIKYRKALAKRDSKNPQPVPQQKTQASTPRIPERQRMAATTTQARDQNSATDRLRKTGSIEDAAKALMKFV